MTASIQLWSVREVAAQSGWGDAVREIAELGFTSVEPFAIHLMRGEFGSSISDSGLRLSSAHGFLEAEHLGATLDAASELGVTTVIHPHFGPDHWTDASALDATAQLLLAAQRAAATRGMRVGFHNHEHELLHEVDGQPAFWALLERLPEDVLVEYDVYWAAVAHADIRQDLERLGSRAAVLHIKDGPYGAAAEDQVALGDGHLALDEFLAAAPHAVPVLSLDRMPGSADDIRTAVARSSRWLDSRGLL